MKFLHVKIQQTNFCRFLILIGVIVTLVLKRQFFLHFCILLRNITARIQKQYTIVITVMILVNIP